MNKKTLTALGITGYFSYVFGYNAGYSNALTDTMRSVANILRKGVDKPTMRG